MSSVTQKTIDGVTPGLSEHELAAVLRRAHFEEKHGKGKGHGIFTHDGTAESIIVSNKQGHVVGHQKCAQVKKALADVMYFQKYGELYQGAHR